MPTSSSKIAHYTLLGLLGLLSLLYLVTGGAKVIMADFMVTNMAAMNFGLIATIVIGIIEVAAIPLLWLPNYRTLALAILLLIMAGSAGAHWGIGHPPAEVIPSFIIAVIIFATLWLDRGKALWAFIFREAGSEEYR